jgi:hypothetical protein
MTNKQRPEEFDYATTAWIYAGPSKRLRALYAMAEDIQRRMDVVRRSNPCPEHAPTSCRIISSQLRELRVEHDRIEHRILRLEEE